MTITEQPVNPHPTPPGPVGSRDDHMTASQWARLLVLLGLFVVLTVTSGIWGLVVVLGIVFMVFLHELGHYVAAKHAGMKVTEFFIGFGPRIWSFRRGETEYGLKVIPAGAYVRIIGMHSLEEVDPADEARSYRQGRFRDRFMVVTAGPLMNLAAALVLIWVVLAGLGAPNGSITKAPNEANWHIDKIYPGTGAAAGGMRAGDKITAINGRPVAKYSDLRPLIRNKQGQTVSVTYLRNGTTTTVPVALRRYRAEEGREACCLGVRQYLSDWQRKRVNPVVAVPQSFAEMGTITVTSLESLGGFFSPTGLRSFGDQVVHARGDRTVSGSSASPASSSSANSSSSSGDSPGDSRLVSLVGVFQIGTDAAASGIGGLLLLFVLLNISLGIINLVPLLPFDGGHAAIAVYEKVQERRRRMSTRYFTDINRLMPLTYVVVLLLVGIFVTTTYLDLASPLKIE